MLWSEPYSLSFGRVKLKAVQERLRVVKVNATFEIAALFYSPHRRLKKRGIFKSCIFFDYPESFLYYLYYSVLLNYYKYFTFVNSQATYMIPLFGITLFKRLNEYLYIFSPDFSSNGSISWPAVAVATLICSDAPLHSAVVELFREGVTKLFR